MDFAGQKKTEESLYSLGPKTEWAYHSSEYAHSVFHNLTNTLYYNSKTGATARNGIQIPIPHLNIIIYIYITYKKAPFWG